MASSLDEFIQTIARLRAPDGCPWDREQNHDTLARYLLEEAYEVLEAIHLADANKLKEELGDLLLQIVLNAQIAQEAGEFSFDDVARSINQKMIARHPHVFGERNLETTREVMLQWQELKEQEKSASGQSPSSAIDGVPKTLPALMQALKISEKACAQGFEWENIDQVWEQLLSELDELKEAIAAPPSEDRRRQVDLELGDVLFTMVNLARWQSLNPEESLLLSTEKFKQRFQKMEGISARPLKEMSARELGELWKRAKIELG